MATAEEEQVLVQRLDREHIGARAAGNGKRNDLRLELGDVGQLEVVNELDRVIPAVPGDADITLTDDEQFLERLLDLVGGGVKGDRRRLHESEAEREVADLGPDRDGLQLVD